MPDAKLRLFCFPFAGGSTNTYMEWVKYLPKEVEVVLVQPPGRGSRMFEAPHKTMETLVAEIMECKAYITQKPYIFFGHSLGGLVAYELSCQLYNSSMLLPRHFIASGCCAPHQIRDRQVVHNLPKSDFIESLKKLNGTPREVLANEELMELVIPMLRADFQIAETYRGKLIPMPFPLLVLNGKEDANVCEHQLNAWNELSKVRCQRVTVPGDHFFIHQYQEKVISQVLQVVKVVLYKAAQDVAI